MAHKTSTTMLGRIEALEADSATVLGRVEALERAAAFDPARPAQPDMILQMESLTRSNLSLAADFVRLEKATGARTVEAMLVRVEELARDSAQLARVKAAAKETDINRILRAVGEGRVMRDRLCVLQTLLGAPNNFGAAAERGRVIRGLLKSVNRDGEA